MTQIFNTTVYRGSANFIGTATNSPIHFNVIANDFGSLERALAENGLSDLDISELRLALDSEPAPKTPEKFGPKVGEWIAKMVGKAATGAWKISLDAAGSLLGQAIAKYYGL